MYKDLSKTQIEILTFIKEEINKRGFPPSVREIGTHTGLSSTSSVHYQLNNLEKKGYIKRDSSKQRALEVIDFSRYQEENENLSYLNNSEIISIPMVGKVTAGEPILAVENIEDTFPLPDHFVGNKPCFILNVSGDSMIEAGILDGDMIVVSKQEVANNGDIVVALLEDEATVKTFYKEDNVFRLQPENSSLNPIYTNTLEILGKVIGVIRKI